MNKFERQDLIKNLQKNRRQIEIVLNYFTTIHNDAVGNKRKANDLSLDNLFAKTFLPLQMAIFEIELLLLIHSSGVIGERFINANPRLSSKSEQEKWCLFINFLFSERYSGTKGVTARYIGATAASRLKTILDLINTDLAPFMELRNRLVHGQWHCTFNKDPYALVLNTNKELTSYAWKITKKETMLVKALVRHVPKLLVYLITSKAQFDEEFDNRMSYIISAKEDADIKYQLKFKKTVVKNIPLPAYTVRHRRLIDD